jgi:hypothetical protein
MIGVTKVATLDRRHFGPIQPQHAEGDKTGHGHDQHQQGEAFPADQ